MLKPIKCENLQVMHGYILLLFCKVWSIFGLLLVVSNLALLMVSKESTPCCAKIQSSFALRTSPFRRLPICILKFYANLIYQLGQRNLYPVCASWEAYICFSTKNLLCNKAGWYYHSKLWMIAWFNAIFSC